jgi:hypothetical protein
MRSVACRVDNPTEYANKDEGEEQSSPVCAAATITEPAPVGDVGITTLTLSCQGNSVLDTAATLENIGIIRRVVPFANNLCAGELKLLGE